MIPTDRTYDVIRPIAKRYKNICTNKYKAQALNKASTVLRLKIRFFKLFLLFLGLCRVIIFKNFSNFVEGESLPLAGFFLCSSASHYKETRISNLYRFLQAHSLSQTNKPGIHFLQNHVVYNLNFVSRRYTKVCGRYGRASESRKFENTTLK